MTIILSNLNRFFKKFTGRFLGKFAVKWILQIPPHLAYVTTLPCETPLSANYKIVWLHILRVVGLLIIKLRKVYCWVLVKKCLKSVNIWQSYKQERGCLMHFARLANTLLKDEESARDNHVLAPPNRVKSVGAILDTSVIGAARQWLLWLENFYNDLRCEWTVDEL